MLLLLFYPLIPSLAQINMYVTDLRFAYTCLSKSSLEQTLFPICPKIANAPCTNVQMCIASRSLTHREQTTTSYWKACSTCVLVASEAPSPSLFFLSLSLSLSHSLTCPSRQSGSHHFSHKISLTPKIGAYSSLSKSPRQPPLTDRRSGRHWTRVSVCAPFHRFFHGLPSYLPNSRPCPATAILQSPPLIFLYKNLK